ncbi:MAG: PDZ domain-containing protein [Chloroflexota bacterium]
MTERQRHLVIVLSILFIAIVCGAIVLVARNFFQDEVPTPAPNTTSLFSNAIQAADGVQILEIVPDSPAAQVNIPVGSVLIGIDGRPVNQVEDVSDYMQLYEGDGNVVLTLKEASGLTTKTIQLPDGDKILGLTLTPDIRSNLEATPTPEATAVLPEESDPSLPTPTPIIAPPVITEIITNTVAATVGLQVGDVIVQVDDKIVLNNAELVEEIASRAPGTAVRLTIRRGEETRIITLSLSPHPQDPNRGFLGVGLQEQP